MSYKLEKVFQEAQRSGGRRKVVDYYRSKANAEIAAKACRKVCPGVEFEVIQITFADAAPKPVGPHPRPPWKDNP